MKIPNKRVLVCYIPGLDARRISQAATPAISALIDRYSSLEMTSLPGSDLAPVLLSGTYPHQNRIWQVSLNSRRERTLGQRLIDLLPDILTTTVGCAWQAFSASDFDLAAVPPRRRRELILHRLTEVRRAASPELLDEFNGYPSLTGLLGGNSTYRFTLELNRLDEFVEELPDDSIRFDFLQNHSFDILQHWYIDDEAVLAGALARTDRLVASLRDKCARSGHTLVLLSDHGQAPVTKRIPLVQTLRNSGVPKDEYSYYCELPSARLWFHTDRARDTITPLIEQLPDCHLLHYREMHRYDVCFEDESFGEYYVMADPGSIFFPHDFWQPLANVYLAFFEPSQRCRLFNPTHRGNHGYLPHHPSEKGFMVVADDSVKPNRETMTVFDFAPTMLTYFGEDVPDYMSGENVLDG